MNQRLTIAIGIEATTITRRGIINLIGNQLEIESQFIIKHTMINLCTPLKFLLIRSLKDTLQVSIVQVEDIVGLTASTFIRKVMHMTERRTQHLSYPIGVMPEVPRTITQAVLDLLAIVGSITEI